jgi:hypothetical protein
MVVVFLSPGPAKIEAREEKARTSAIPRVSGQAEERGKHSPNSIKYGINEGAGASGQTRPRRSNGDRPATKALHCCNWSQVCVQYFRRKAKGIGRE